MEISEVALIAAVILASIAAFIARPALDHALGWASIGAVALALLLA